MLISHSSSQRTSSISIVKGALAKMSKKRMANRKGFTPLEILPRGNNMRKPAGKTRCRPDNALKRSTSKGVKRKFLTGVTLIELMVATGLASTVIVGIGVVLVDSQRGWNAMYNRTYSDVVTDAHVARRMFDSVVRNASSQGILVDEAGSWVEVYTYSDPNSPVVDVYAKFQAKNGHLTLEYGELDSGATLSIDPICGNVSSCVFKSSGRSVQMILTLDNGSKSVTVVTSAVMHN